MARVSSMRLSSDSNLSFKSWMPVAATLLNFAFPSLAVASGYFVRSTGTDSQISSDTLYTTTTLIKGVVASRAHDRITKDEASADFVLQPRLLRLGTSWVLTVEKIGGARRDEEILFAAQTKITSITQLEPAARAATIAAIEEPGSAKRTKLDEINEELYPAAPYQVAIMGPKPEAAPVSAPVAAPVAGPALRLSQQNTASTEGTVSGATAAPDDRVIVVPPTKQESSTGAPRNNPANVGEPVDGLVASPNAAAEARPAQNHWTAGVGTLISRRLSDDRIFYNIGVSHDWEINPNFSLKVLLEGNFSSGDGGARLYSFAGGASYYFQTASIEGAPFVSADVGLGYANDTQSNSATGVGFGMAAGYQFLRNTAAPLDVMLRYSSVLSPIGPAGSTGNPSVAGARVALNF